jgi:hypothetical protein
MIDTSHIKQMVTHILRRQRGVPDREAMDPGREWSIGVFATLLLVILGGLVSYGLYLNTISLEVDANQMPAVAIPYNAAIVDQTVLNFRVRTEAYDKIRGVREDALLVPVATTTEPLPSDLIDETVSVGEAPVETKTEDEPAQNGVVPEEVDNQEDVRPALGV